MFGISINTIEGIVTAAGLLILAVVIIDKGMSKPTPAPTGPQYSSAPIQFGRYYA